MPALLHLPAVKGGAALPVLALIGTLFTLPWASAVFIPLMQVLVSPVVGIATGLALLAVGVLAFGWLWGIWGLVLGMPVLLMVKTVCDRIDDLKPIGELLGS